MEGAHGNPLERDPEMVESDVIEGYVSLDKAEEDYGMVVDPKTTKVDREAARKLRSQKV
jgi:N-methylhydantoinase B